MYIPDWLNKLMIFDCCYAANAVPHYETPKNKLRKQVKMPQSFEYGMPFVSWTDLILAADHENLSFLSKYSFTKILTGALEKLVK